MGDALPIVAQTASVVSATGLWGQIARGAWLAAPLGRSVVVLLVVQAVLFAVLFAGSHGWIVPLDHPVSADFLSFYAAGVLADQGQAIAAYSRAAHEAMEQALAAPGIDYQYFLYPPPFLLICAALGRLQWITAFIGFQAVTMLFCLAVLRATLRLPARMCIAALLAFPAVGWVLLLGQNSFLTAALFGGALLLLQKRPVIAGLLIAGLSYKPHLALLIPVALAAGGYWRTFIAAAAGVLALCIITSLLFGLTIWPAYVASFAATQVELQAGLVGRFGAMVTPYGALRAAGVVQAAATLGHAVAAIAAAAVVAVLWHRRAPWPLRAAALLSGALVAAPFALFYDLMLVLVALCWLLRLGLSHGFPPWSKSLMAVCWLLPITPLLTILLHGPQIPVAALIAPALLLLCWRWHAGGGPPSSDLPPRDGSAAIRLSLVIRE
jgi:alpha-1,2-mannosyltransferase